MRLGQLAKVNASVLLSAVVVSLNSLLCMKHVK